MAKLVEKIILSDDGETPLAIQRQTNSSRWYARFKVNGIWKTKATAESNRNKAIGKAFVLLSRYETLSINEIDSHDSAIHRSKWFQTIAEEMCEQWLQCKEKNPAKYENTYVRHIQVTRKWFIPFFGKTSVAKIDDAKYLEFREWQEKENGAPFSRSSVVRHNVVLRKIFKEAKLRKLITELPEMNNNGTAINKRAAFSENEYELILKEAIKRAGEAKGVAASSHQLIPSYIEWARRTGMRPGKEMNQLTWANIVKQTQGNETYTICKVTKGKTVERKGPREVVLDDNLVVVIAALKKLKPNAKPTDLLFADAEGKIPRYSQLVNGIINDLGLTVGIDGERSLYSLRHTYITDKLRDGTHAHKISKQVGTTLKMIEDHYGHITALDFAGELSGRKSKHLRPLNAAGLDPVECSSKGIHI